ncbi:DUF1641 domain-containing protein [Picrophilus oshimae]|uniref:Uncharacterized conserved protein YjgD, DUF1641 family n=1 Tax=Picrophilus torridus (strain ATCC 700027 / DSM 9790 / JCM 10055 / NBRC 100828 / KAW 2/3) TaxID=1122961 RepID=A0A8G2FX69_PICTO|nr:DUF1641 domain-containing protein [Picrophilus oshimae]SMD31119.1 Uncharacterized conserved protein YjgD, DUF1641 family [Picrophilus oshimae DSM 9789]
MKEELDFSDMMDIVSKISENKDIIYEIFNLISKLRDSGLIDALKTIEGILPDNLDFLVKSVTSKDYLDIIFRAYGTLNSIIYMLAEPNMSEIIKIIGYNSSGIAQSMIDGTSSGQPISIFKLMSMLKDPEISAALNGIFDALKIIGDSVKKLK